LGFQKLDILPADVADRISVRHHAKFCGNRSNRYRNIAIFRFSRWAVAMLNFKMFEILTAIGGEQGK